MINKLWATKEIYDIVIRAINARETSGISRNDTLQMLLDSGDERLVVVGVRNPDATSFLRHLTIF
jgi:sterol 14-demethylase